MTLLPKSIRWRLQLWHGMLLLGVLAAFGVTAWKLERDSMLREIDAELQPITHMGLGMLHHGPPRAAGGPPSRPPRALRNLFSPFPEMEDSDLVPPPPEMQDWLRDEPEEQHYAIAWDENHEMIMAAGKLSQLTSLPDQSGVSLGIHARSRVNPDGMKVRELFVFTPPGDCVLVGRSIRKEQTTLDNTAWRLAGFGAGVWVLGLAIGGIATTRALRPIKTISSSATRIADGHLDERISVEDTETELGSLASVLNNTFERLEHSFEKQAQFTADAAHELRTPVTVLLSQTQLALSRERDPQQYRDALSACERAAKRMQSLTESLLQLSRLDAGAEPMLHEAIDLAELAKDVVSMVQPLAEEHGVRLELQASVAPGVGDADQLTQVLTNIITNALHHSPENATITITTGAAPDGASFASIQDQGPGISAEHLPHLFERFYRADASRNRNSGGAGLGLAICKAIVDAHNGSIEARSELGKGSEFVITLPPSKTHP